MISFTLTTRLSNLLTLRVPDAFHSRNASSELNQLSTFLLPLVNNQNKVTKKLKLIQVSYVFSAKFKLRKSYDTIMKKVSFQQHYDLQCRHNPHPNYLYTTRVLILVSNKYCVASIIDSTKTKIAQSGGRRVRDRMVVGFTTTYAISDYHLKRCEIESHSSVVYSIQHYVIKSVSDLLQVGGFLRVLRFPPSIKLTAAI